MTIQNIDRTDYGEEGHQYLTLESSPGPPPKTLSPPRGSRGRGKRAQVASTSNKSDAGKGAHLTQDRKMAGPSRTPSMSPSSSSESSSTESPPPKTWQELQKKGFRKLRNIARSLLK